ncbi:uncharacterized protein LOC111131536 isoform X2 [Crassostrea virginica]
MADSTYTRSTVSHQALRNTISETRKSSRQYSNELQDAKLEENLSGIPCKKSAKPLLEETSALIEECLRLLSHLQKGNSLTPSTKCCIDSEKKEDAEGNNCTMDPTVVKGLMSKSRKIIRQYNDDLDDGEHVREDRRPCGVCKDSIHRECQGLVKELEKITSLFAEGSLKDICHCQYCCVSMRKDAGRRKNDDRDSGIVSADSTMFREASETLDPSSTPDTTECKVLPDIPKLSENEKGPCVSLYGSGSSFSESGSTDA